MIDRISFISGLANYNGDILREYIQSHYEIVNFIYNFIGNNDKNNTSVINSDKDSLTIRFNLAPNSLNHSEYIKSYLTSINGTIVYRVKLNIDILETKSDYIIVKFNTMSV